MLGARLLAEVVFLLAWLPLRRSQAGIDPFYEVCSHEYYDNVAEPEEIKEGQLIYRDIRRNQTHRYFYYNWDLPTLNYPNTYRRLIINLEPCRGVVYLFVRKTRRCYPDPYSCVTLDPTTLQPRTRPNECKWTAFKSQIDGSMDGTPTFFEVDFTTTKWYLSVYATQNSQYTLNVLADIGIFPRPGALGLITGKQIAEGEVEIEWSHAYYNPTGVTDTRQYYVYSSLLLDGDNSSSIYAFLRPNKIMNSVCGLENNTDKPYDRVPAISGSCDNVKCKFKVWGIFPGKRYLFNIVAESNALVKTAYAGLVMKTEWTVIRHAEAGNFRKVVGAVAGSALGLVVIIYFSLLKMYG